MNSIPTYPSMEYDCAVCGASDDTVVRIPAVKGAEVNYFVGLCAKHRVDIFAELIRMENEWQKLQKEYQAHNTSLDVALRSKSGEGTYSLGDVVSFQQWSHTDGKTIDSGTDNIKGVTRRLYRNFGWGARRITRLIHTSYGLHVSQRTITNYLQEIKEEGIVPKAYIENPVWLDEDTKMKNTLWRMTKESSTLEQKAKAQEASEVLIPFSLAPENIRPPQDGSALYKAQKEERDYLLRNIAYATVTNQM